MNILITNIWLDNHAGTEVYVRDLSIALKSRGMGVEVYTPMSGKVAGEIMSNGINVSNSVENLKNIPDIIHGHHQVVIDAITKFPQTPVVYFCHSGNILQEDPVIHPSIKKYIAVDQFCMDRLDNKGITNSGIIHNWVDTHKFRQKEKINDIPLRALVVSNVLSEANVSQIRKACDEMGMELDCMGREFGNSIANPEDIMTGYDIIFAKAKCAIEAIGSGCATILCDYSGLGEMVTSSNYENAKRYNFGFKMLSPVRENKIKDRVLEELRKYDSADIKKISDRIREESSFDKILLEIVEEYKKILNN